MEILIVIGLIWFVSSLFSGGSRDYSYANSYSNDAPQLATLSIRKVPGNDNGNGIA